MALVPLKFRPGIVRDTTLYANEGGWFFCDKMRFRNGFPEKIGGWQKYLTNQLLGTARSILVSADLDGIHTIAVGTNLKYYIVRSGTLIDITPLRVTHTMAASPFAVTNLSTTATVTDAAHGASAGDFVTFASATAVGGITAAQLNQNFQIQSVPTVNTYTITLPAAATSTTTGGGTPTAAYEIPVGLASQVSGPGWGAGVWNGTQTWNGDADTSIPGNQIRLWSQVVYGQNIVFCARNGAIYQWDADNPNGRATAITALSTANNVPTVTTEIFMADTSRQVFALGTNPIGSAIQDPMHIRWTDLEDLGDWYPQVDNAAGSLRLSQGSRIITASQTHQEIIVFTDAALYALQFTGYPYYWGASLISTGQSIIGPNAKATVNQTIFWMGETNFYYYDGHAQTMECPLQDYVFNDMDPAQTDKIYAGVNSDFSEIWWFYPSLAGAGECDSYVVYNYKDNVWHYGSMTRTAWADAGIEQYPVAMGADGYLYYHEYGADDGSSNPAVAIPSFIQSSQMEMDPGGNNYAFANRFIPDVTFRGTATTAATPSVTFIFYPQDFPGAAEKTGGSGTVARSVSVPVEQFTTQAWIRLRGRAMMIRVESNQVGCAFRLGTSRLDIRQDGKR